MSFEFSSKYYKYFLLAAVSVILVWDTINLFPVLIGKYKVQTFYLIMAFLGYAIRLTILVLIIQKKGPIKLFVVIWGGLMIFGALSGYLALLTAPNSPPIAEYLIKTAFLVFGLALVLPLSKSIAYKQNA